MNIASLRARQILDSRGVPTVEVDCILESGHVGRAAVPSGASTGSHEALELRDGDTTLYAGKSVRKAVENVAIIERELKGKNAKIQATIDDCMLQLDGTENKSRLGANAILAVSMAVCRARAAAEGLPLWKSLAEQYGVRSANTLPVPLMNVLNGGAHADSGLSFQEFMLVPYGFTSFHEALRAGAETFQILKGVLKARGQVIAVGDEGGFAPHLAGAKAALDLLVLAIEKAGYTGKIGLALDCAANEFFDGKKTYTVDGTKYEADALVNFYKDLVSSYPIVSIEDPFAEDDWQSFTSFVQACPKLQVVGDDLFVTNVLRIEKGITMHAANAVLIKLNQIGTVSETVAAISKAQSTGWRAIVSHRSGETEDTFIADLAVGLQTGQIKTGSLSRSERICKYNQLLRIEEELEAAAVYASPFGE